MKNYVIFKKVLIKGKIKAKNIIVCNNLKNTYKALNIINNSIKDKIYIKVSNKAYTKFQKAKIQGIKQNIIDNDTRQGKNILYNELIEYLSKLHSDFIQNIEYKDNISIDYKIANDKISANDTIIFSITPALICESAIKGYCQLYKNKICYALKNELQYNFSILFKNRQMIQWNNKKAYQLALNFIRIAKKNEGIKYLRINESGDITINDLKKLNVISNILKKYGIKVYTYTHNEKINKDMIQSDNLTINSSIENKKLDNQFLSYDSKYIDSILAKKQKNVFRCKGDCSICKLCIVKNKDLLILCDIH